MKIFAKLLPLRNSRHVISLNSLVKIRSFSMDFNGNANKVLLSTGKPPFIYGTAWKKERTTELVKQALKSGFRAIDTAAQPKHYQEALVGDAVRDVLREGVITRDQLYVRSRISLLSNLHVRAPSISLPSLLSVLYNHQLTECSTAPNQVHVSPWTGSQEHAV